MVRVLLIMVSLLIAVASGWATKQYIDYERARLAQATGAAREIKPKGEKILIVQADVPIGGQLSTRILDWQFWPESNIRDIHIRQSQWPDAATELDGAGARQNLFAGDPVVEGKIVRMTDRGFLAAVLTQGKRAVTLTVDPSTGLAGLVFPGDRVDVILTHSPPSLLGAGGGAESKRDSTAAETILRNIRVLAVDKSFAPPGEDGELKKAMPTTVTLEVEPHQAETLALGRSMGRLSLVLRSSFGEAAERDDRQRHFTRDIEISELLQQGNGQPKILVAARPLDAGELVSDLDFDWMQPDFAVVERDFYIEGRDTILQMRGSLILEAIETGAPIHRRQLLRPNDPSFVSRALRPGFRAVSIPVNASTAVSGFITPGDIVDIVLTDQWDDERDSAILKTRFFGETIATHVRVLSLPLSVGEEDGGEGSENVQASSTATLEVSPSQAESLALAQEMGSLTLILRSKADAELASEHGPSPWITPAPKLATHHEVPAALREPAKDAGFGAGPPGSYSFELDTSDALKALVIEPMLQGLALRRLRENSGKDRQSITVFRGTQEQTIPLR